MQSPTYSEPKTADRPVRKTVAPGVIEQHSRLCRATRAGRGCSCKPTYHGRVKRDGKTHARTFATLTEAVAWTQSTRDAFRRGESLAPAPAAPATPFRAVAVSFVHRAKRGEALNRSRQRFGNSTVAGYEVELRLRVLEHQESRSGLALGELPVAEVDARMVQGVVDAIARDSQACARRAAAAIASVLRFAYEQGLRDELPPRVLLPPPPARRTHVLTEQQRRTFRAAAFADDRARRRSLLGPLTTLLDDTGLRVSEALGLVWGPDGIDLDGEEPRVRIKRDSTKTDAGVRVVVLSRATATTMRRHRLACGRAPDGASVFADKQGRPLNRSGRVRAGLVRVTEATGIELSPHVFRHTHATELAASGVSPAVAASRLGHADGGVTFLRTYVHVGEAQATDAAAQLRAYRSQAGQAS